MNELGRRSLLAGAAAIGGGLVSAGLTTPASAEPANGAGAAEGFGTIRIGRDDPRYQGMTNHLFNTRFTSKPDYVQVVDNTADVVAAVQDAVRAQRRITVRSGGHCFEGFAINQETRALIDLSEMNNVYYDRHHNAIAVETGAKLGQVYQSLYKVFGTTIPAGSCPSVWVGGHVIGGGYGLRSRELGCVVDYIHGVEVVVVDRGGRASAVVATREESDPNRDLWWAHTGGGGGNFGVVTRVLLRSPGATGTDPTTLLPKSSQFYQFRNLSWGPGKLTEPAFGKLVGNFTAWMERNSAPGSPAVVLCPFLTAQGVSTAPEAPMPAMSATVSIGVDPDLDTAASLLNEITALVTAGVDPAPEVSDQRAPILAITGQPGPDETPAARAKTKAAYHRKGFTADQRATLYRNLTTRAPYPALTNIVLHGYGGRVNAVAPGATAVAQRCSVFKAIYTTIWAGESDDAAALGAARRWYGDMYADSGGVPAPNDATDGTYINYPDVDLADPAVNTSGVPWQTLYYQGNYPRLQRIKATWDPGDVFHHPLSIRPPG